MPAIDRPAARNRRLLLGGLASLLVATTLVVVLLPDARDAVRQALPGGDEAAVAAGPYRLAPDWDAEIDGLPVAYHPDGGTVLLWSNDDALGPLAPHHISARDTRTGELRWSSGPEGWDVNIDYVRGGLLSADAVIVQSNPQRDAPAVAALRLTDGKVLWQVPTPGESGRPTAVAADVVVVAWDDSTVRGLGAADGRTRWESPVPAGCRADEVAARGDLAAVEIVCDKRRHVELLDAGTGRAHWRRDVPIESQITADNLSIRGAAVLLHDRENLLILNRSGEAVLEETSRDLGDVRFTTVGDLAVVGYRDRAGQNVLTAVDLGGGGVRWRHRLAVASLVHSGQRLYALTRPPEPLLPITLYAIDAATGRHSASVTDLISAEFDSLVAVDGDLAVTYYWADRVAHLAGHRLEPRRGPAGRAGGAPDADWPDGCGLLQVAELTARVPGVTYQGQPVPATLVDAPLSRPVLCRYQPSDVDAPLVSAGIAWVGADTPQAVRLMEQLGRQAEANRLPGIGEEAVEVVEFAEPRSRTRVFFRVGPRIGTVSLIGDSATARALAGQAAARLG